MEPALLDLRSRLAEVSDLSRAAGVLGWDQRVTMPPRGTEARAEQLSTLGRIAHQRFTDDEVGRLLDRAEPLVESHPYDSDDRSLVRVTRRDWEKARRVPTELRAEMTLQAARGHHAWVEARRTSDFASFLPYLRTNVELKRRYIECFEWSDSPYTPLLDDYEPGMLTTEVQEVFAVLRPALTELVAAAPEVDASFLHGDFAPEAQRVFAERVLRTMGFDDDAWRLDPTAHPFCTSFSNRDVRLTTRYRPDDLESVWSTMHEAGHGLYAHGIADALLRSPLHGAPSLGINESQSRTWENLVGRSRAFWRWFYPRLQQAFAAQFGSIDEEAFYRAVNKVRPSLIRIDADEVTYNMHILVRFELEVALLRDELSAADLPAAWNDAYRRRLGVAPANDGEGVLQDVHWSSGAFGYFPTYTIGNLYSALLWNALKADIPDIHARIEAGDFAPLLGWLRDRIHRPGYIHEGEDLIRSVTGSGLTHEPFVAYLWEKYGDLYGVSRTA